MNHKIGFQVIVSHFVIAMALMITPLAGYATEQGEQRREARDTRLEARQQSRAAKTECKAGDEKTRVECRQKKRGTKQNARKEARDIKY
jgi:Ni/Co efflux regulator RcnB